MPTDTHLFRSILILLSPHMHKINVVNATVEDVYVATPIPVTTNHSSTYNNATISYQTASNIPVIDSRNTNRNQDRGHNAAPYQSRVTTTTDNLQPEYHMYQAPNHPIDSANNTNEETHPYKGRFKGVVRKKAKAYIITGIDLDSDQKGLEDFLVDIGVEYKSAKFLYTRRTDSQVAQIVVHEDQAEILENPDTWPTGVQCRVWLKRTDYRKRYYGQDEYDPID